MAHDAREKSNQRLVPRQALLMRELTGLIQAAAKQLDPPVLEKMVRGVGTQLGRQALSECRLLRQAGGWLRGYTWAECLKEIGEQFGWRLRVAVESEGVIRVRVLACGFGESDEFGSYLCEFGSGLFGGATAKAIGDVKVCMSRCSETPPRDCVLTIYFRPSKKSLAARGTVYRQMSDLAARGAEGPLDSMPGARLTSREAQILRHIAHGLPDKEIAERLQLSVRTVENHAARMRKKLSVGNRAALVRFAFRAHLVDSP